MRSNYKNPITEDVDEIREELVQRRPTSLLFFPQLANSVPACFWFDCQLLLGLLLQFVCCWNRWSFHQGTMIDADILLFTVFPWSRNKLIWLRLHTCASGVIVQCSLWSEHKSLGRTLSLPESLLGRIVLLRVRHRCL